MAVDQLGPGDTRDLDRAVGVLDQDGRGGRDEHLEVGLEALGLEVLPVGGQDQAVAGLVDDHADVVGRRLGRGFVLAPDALGEDDADLIDRGRFDGDRAVAVGDLDPGRDRAGDVPRLFEPELLAGPAEEILARRRTGGRT